MSLNVRFQIFRASTYAIVFAVSLIFCILLGKIVEFAGFFFSFVLLRYSFGKTYHSKSYWNCIAISILIFLGVILFVPNKNLSILSCVIFGLFVDFVANKCKDYQDLLEEHSKPFSTETCTQEELVKRCREIHLSAENELLAIEFFIKKTKQSEIAESLRINTKSVQIRKSRLREKLNKL